MPQYRVIDLRTPAIDKPGTHCSGKSPEAAATNLLGFEVIRSGPRHNLVARAYWQNPDQPISMVRLYRRVTDEQLTQ